LSNGICHLRKKFASEKKLRIVSVLEKVSNEVRQEQFFRDKVFARFSIVFLGVLVCLKSVFSDEQDVKQNRDITPHPHLFHGTNSHEAAKVVHRKWG